MQSKGALVGISRGWYLAILLNSGLPLDGDYDDDDGDDEDDDDDDGRAAFGAQAVMRPTYVQLCSRADRVPGMSSNVVGVPPTAAAKREDWIL